MVAAERSEAALGYPWSPLRGHLSGIRKIRGSDPACVSWKVKHGDSFENTESAEATELRATSESLQVDLPSIHPRNPYY